jgi:hypothetical protein
MPDLKQALRDFVATSNSGKYSDEATLLSKFPELQGYDINSLRDFVATSNSNKYASEDELFSKFPEFGVGGQQPELKKKKSQYFQWLHSKSKYQAQYREHNLLRVLLWQVLLRNYHLQ